HHRRRRGRDSAAGGVLPPPLGGGAARSRAVAGGPKGGPPPRAPPPPPPCGVPPRSNVNFPPARHAIARRPAVQVPGPDDGIPNCKNEISTGEKRKCKDASKQLPYQHHRTPDSPSLTPLRTMN